MVFFLGCDVSKTKINTSLVNEHGIEQWSDVVANDEISIATFLLCVYGAYPEAEVDCVVEATSRYHMPLAETCTALGLQCIVFNPLLTKQHIRATIRGKKTDSSDALIIARIGLRGEGRPYVPEVYPSTKYLGRGVQRLGVLNHAFRQYKHHLEDTLEGQISPDLSELIDAVQTAITTARKQSQKDMALSAEGQLFTRLQTIPGVGPFIAASIIGEVQDMSRFKTATTFIAYAGLDPRIRQSGTTLNATGRLTKRGSSYLRRSAFIAASVARKYDPVFNAYYEQKRAEGKSYKVATVATARKMLRVVRAVWLSGEDYDPR